MAAALKVPSSDTLALPKYDDAHAYLAELRRLASEANAADLTDPLARLAEECRSRWQLGEALGTNLLCSSAANGAPRLPRRVGSRQPRTA